MSVHGSSPELSSHPTATDVTPFRGVLPVDTAVTAATAHAKALGPSATVSSPARSGTTPTSSVSRLAAPVATVPTTPSTGPAPTTSAPSAPAPSPAPASAQAGANPNSYAFALTNSDNTPIRWNPCASIHYVTNLAEAPSTAAGDVTQALRMLSDATGLSFIFDGTTTEVPSSERATNQSRYGSGHAPLLIAWTRQSETDIYNGEGPNTVGTASTTWIGAMPGAANQEAAYVTGQIAIEPGATSSFPAGFGSGRTIGLVLLHELGHVAGLAHVGDSNQVMYPQLMSLPSAQYAAGDRTGLARLGSSAGCLAPR